MAHAKCRSNSARRFATSVHPLREGGFRRIQRLGTTNRLTTRTSRLTRCRTSDERLVLVHLYMLGSDGDYNAHRKLWPFLVDRIAIDLKSVGIGRPDEMHCAWWATRQFGSKIRRFRLGQWRQKPG